MRSTRQPDDQAALWNGPSGHAWVDAQETLDQMFKGIEDLIGEKISRGSNDRVLDVGCGTGGTTIAFARRLGENSHCVGIDISEPMIAAARARAEREDIPVRFICADAQHHAFEPVSFDTIVSRFGVMFFDDPVQAFINLRRAAAHRAELTVVVWRSAAENPFMTTAERAAAPLLPDLPARQPDAPGQFAFADQRRVARILDESGWSAVEIRPVDVACAFPETELTPYLTRLGPVGRVIQDLDDRTRARVTQAVRAAFEPYVQGGEVRFTAACWMATARATR
jgi:SAM-dependent methyltransferase